MQALKSHSSYPRPYITLFQFWMLVVVRWKLLALNFSSALSLPTYTLTIFSLTPAPFSHSTFFSHSLAVSPSLTRRRTGLNKVVNSSVLKNLYLTSNLTVS